MITPKFINVEINSKTQAAIKAKQKAIITWVTIAIKTLYKKINKLTTIAYNSQLKPSKTLHGMEYESVIRTIENKTEKLLRKKRKTIKKKLQDLIRQQRQTHETEQPTATTRHKFYNRVHNVTHIELNEQEHKLLEKGLKFNIALPNNKTQNIRQLLEIENAIKRTDELHQDDIRTLIAIGIQENKTKINKHQHKKERLTIKSINEYIGNNNIIKLTEDPTNKYHKEISKTINNCKTLFNPTQV